MNLDYQIEKVDKEISVKRVDLEELIIALNVIDHQITKLRTEIESYGEYLEVLKDERRR